MAAELIAHATSEPAAPISWALRLITTGLPSLFRMRVPPRVFPLAFAAASAALVRVDIIPASSSATATICCRPGSVLADEDHA
jgi:hypothetical protein